MDLVPYEAPGVSVIETALCHGAVASTTPCLVVDRSVCLKVDVFTKGCVGVQPQMTRSTANEPVNETVTAKRHGGPLD
jgi:hypothetical protein